MGGVCNESANFASVMSTDAGYERCGVGGLVANGTFLRDMLEEPCISKGVSRQLT
jgi:hypothetical protein